jgi:iron complex outermembrane receptor protein
MRYGKRTLGGGASALALLMAAGGAHAQSEATQVEELTVTARRQAENLQDVPAAVSAFSAETLYQAQVETIGDLQSQVPNLSLHVGDASNAVVYMRGVGQVDSISFNDPGVGVYLDDVYMGRVQGSFLDVIDPQQIEVLRGPQGTLYGRNTIGGALKFTSARPTNEVSGYLDATLGNYDDRRFKAVVGGPIVSDVLLGKVALASSQRDGYTHNRLTGQDDGDKDAFAGRASLLFQPNAAFSAYLTLDASRNRPDTSRTPHRETPIYSVNTGALRPVIADPDVVEATYNDLERLETKGAALTLQYDRGPFTFKSISAYREMEYRTHLDLDSSPDESFGIYNFEKQDQTSQELQLLYKGERLSAVAGLFYFKENDWTFGGLVGPDFFVILPGLNLPFPANTSGLRLSENTSTAAYAQFDYQLTAQASVTLGARYTREKKWTDNRGEWFDPAVAPTAEDMERLFGTGAGFNVTGFAAEEDWSSFTPKIALNYRVSDQTLTYVSASQGFKSGGFNGRNTISAQAFDPETMWSYEAGLKTELAERRVRLNLAAFYQDYKNLQLSRFAADPVTGGFVAVFDNAGRASMYGLEGELTAVVTPQFRIDANAAYLHSQYDEYLDGGVDISDRRHLVNAPKWSGRLGARYEIDLGDAGEVTLMGGVSYRSKTYPTVSSSEVLAQDGYALFDASIAYANPGSPWSVVLSGRNLSDERYREHGFDLTDSPGVQLGYYGAPRTYSINVRYRF